MLTVDLDKLFHELPSYVEGIDGRRVEKDKITIGHEVEDNPALYRIKIDEPEVAGKIVRIRYSYCLLYTSDAADE